DELALGERGRHLQERLARVHDASLGDGPDVPREPERGERLHVLGTEAELVAEVLEVYVREPDVLEEPETRLEPRRHKEAAAGRGGTEPPPPPPPRDPWAPTGPTASPPTPPVPVDTGASKASSTIVFVLALLFLADTFLAWQRVCVQLPRELLLGGSVCVHANA